MAAMAADAHSSAHPTFVTAMELVCTKYELGLPAPVIRDVLECLTVRRQSAMCLAPTGCGKSFCYMLFPDLVAALHGATRSVKVILVTPLIALGHDQSRRLRELRQRVATLFGSSTAEAAVILNGEWDFLVTTPEQLIALQQEGNFVDRIASSFPVRCASCSPCSCVGVRETVCGCGFCSCTAGFSSFASVPCSGSYPWHAGRPVRN